MTKKIPRPRCIGSGLFALDIVIKGKSKDKNAPSFFDAGGSCGNVLSILGYFGWEILPCVRLGKDIPSKIISDELLKYGADLKYASFVKGENAPIIAQFLKNDGKGGHRFDVHHPTTGAMLPRFRPVTISGAAELIAGNETCDVFYCDRITPANIRIAQSMRSKGALVYLEPQRAKAEELNSMLPYTDVLKISEGRIIDMDSIALSKTNETVIIETLGEKGMRIQSSRNHIREKSWVYISGLTGISPIDSAGAGDWTSAYVIHSGAKSLRERDIPSLVTVCSRSRYWSTLAIMFEGARGLMHHFSLESIVELTGDQDAWTRALKTLTHRVPPTLSLKPRPLSAVLVELGI